MRVAINGFGRIGRRIFWLLYGGLGGGFGGGFEAGFGGKNGGLGFAPNARSGESFGESCGAESGESSGESSPQNPAKSLEITHINDICEAEKLVYLLQRDSIFGRFPRTLKLHKDRLILGGSGVNENGVGENDCREIIFSHFSHPKDSRFEGVDVVLETSGAFLERESLGFFLQNGVQKVILGASPKDEMPIFVRGVNEKSYAGEKIISNASCTSNAIAPIIAAISRKHRILRAAVTIIHPFNSDQKLLDSPHAADFRLSRSAHANIIPTKSSICAVLERLFPRVRFAGDSLRVPSEIVCFGLLDLTLDSPMTRAEFLGLEWDENIVGFTGELCVSSDFVGDLRSAVIDCESLRCEGANCRLGVWFDNESAYAARMIEMAGVVGI